MHSVFGGVAGWQPPGWPANESSVHGVGRRLAGPETSEPPWEVSTNSSWVCGAVLREGRSQCECATWLAAAAGLQLLMAASLGLGRHDILVRPLEHLERAEGGKSGAFRPWPSAARRVRGRQACCHAQQPAFLARLPCSDRRAGQHAPPRCTPCAARLGAAVQDHRNSARLACAAAALMRQAPVTPRLAFWFQISRSSAKPRGMATSGRRKYVLGRMLVITCGDG